MPVPLINGINYSWASISVVMFGSPVVGIASVEYKRKQKKENNYGAGPDPVSRGYGMFEYEGSLEFYTDYWKALVANAPGRDPLAIAPFDIQITFGGKNLIPTKDVLRGCEFLEDPFSGKSGDTKLMVKIPLIIAAIER